MTYTQDVTLSVVQGLAEFLPVSSSAHLLLVPYLLGWPDQGLAIDAMLHAGTLAALVGYFKQELMAILTQARGRSLAALIVVATVPAALAGILFEDVIERRLRSPAFVAAWSACWAIFMGIADRQASRPRPGPTDPLPRVTWLQGLGIGLAQAVALVPGTSRSGATISAGLIVGLDRSTAARFAFLLGVPVTAGAAALKTLDLVRGGGVGPAVAGPLFAAFAATVVSGWLAVWFLVSYLRRRSLIPFVLYQVALAAVILVITG